MPDAASTPSLVYDTRKFNSLRPIAGLKSVAHQAMLPAL